MRFVELVTTMTGQVLKEFCSKCDKIMQSDREIIWCDLDGPSFKAYFCTKCKEATMRARSPSTVQEGD